MEAFLGYKMSLVILPAARCAGERFKFSGNKEPVVRFGERLLRTGSRNV